MPTIDRIAAAIHETYRAQAKTEGWAMQPHLDRPFAELAAADQDDNRAAAQRMETVLASAGLSLSTDAAKPALGKDALEPDMERLAQAEHDGWMAHRAASGWTHGAVRDNAAKHHPSMIPYAQLPDDEKEKDRNNVRQYPGFASQAGYRIVRA